MVAEERWARKIVALLHDPPDKPFAIAHHKARAAELQRIALGRAATTMELEQARRADQIASAADRVNFPVGLEADWRHHPAILTHPLAGRPLNLGSLATIDPAATHAALQQVIRELTGGVEDLRRRYLILWRCLTDRAAAALPPVGALFAGLPADTRQPDHPLVQHLLVTAAIADALPRPALLVFALGPVQEFIATARRTQDLWMGSWLLSYLAWVALQSLVEIYGPDVVLFPALRGQPLCDRWLQRQGVPLPPPASEALALATLPNKFVALLPAEEAGPAAQRAEAAVRAEWQRLAEPVFRQVAAPVADDLTWQIWGQQIASQVEVYWVVLPWPGADRSESVAQAEAVKTRYEELCRPAATWVFGQMYSLYARPKERGGGQYAPNWGTTYSLLYALADRAFNARKGLRDFLPIEERGAKCTLCGQRAALRSMGRDARDFWTTVAGRYPTEVRLNGRERLCAVCTVKRFVLRAVLAKEFGLTAGFPSTSEVATAPFKAAVLAHLAGSQADQALVKALREHLETLKHLLNVPPTVSPGAIPKLWRWLEALQGSSRANLARDFLAYDGETLFPETFTVERLREEGLSLSEQDAATVRQALQDFLKAAGDVGVGRPARYYAVLLMDGDRAGRWLSGTHEGLASWGRVLHPEVWRALADQNDWRDLLYVRRLMTPALHAAISAALAGFALTVVRWVVEQRYHGRVVYAGGDDLLALLPLEEALPAARDLRALFTGEVDLQKPLVLYGPDEPLPVAFGQGKITGYLVYRQTPAPEILPTMGPTASASVGVALAHHLQPLDTVLQAARQAEQMAKGQYERNALGVALLKRSGETIQVGTRWFYPAVPDVVALVDDLSRFLRKGPLTMKLAQAVFAEARTLAGLPTEAQRAEVRRLLARHSEGLDRTAGQQLADQLIAFAEGLAAHGRRVGRSGFEQMADWLLLARFLAQGGGE